MKRLTLLLLAATPFVAAACASIVGVPDLPDIAGGGDGGETHDSTTGDGSGSSSGGGDGQAEGSADAGAEATADVASGCPAGQLACDAGCVEAGLVNCGACGHDCTALAHVSGPVSCSASGQCSFPLSSCAPGWTQCTSNPDQGCETSITTTTNCGACNNACPVAMPVCAGDAGSGYSCIGCSAPTPTPCFGSCVDLTSNTANCGACGHDCLGGQCLGSLCQPILLASGLDDPTVIAVGANGVYWMTDPLSADAGPGAVMTCGLDGGTVTTLATEIGFPTGIAVNATTVYWGDQSIGVQECPIGGCGSGPSLLWSGPTKDVAIDATNIYWILEDPGVGLSCPLGGCPAGSDGGADPSTLFYGQPYTQNLAIDGTSIYWSGPDGAFKCPLAGCPLDADGGDVVTALAFVGGEGISVDSANAYWGNSNGLLACAVGGCGGAPRTLAPTTDAYNTATDGINVYWTDILGGAIDRCAISGCNDQPTVMAAGQSPYDLALDSKAIYWTNSTGGTVMRLAK